MEQQVVCFKLISGNEIVGKLADVNVHKSFVPGDGVVYLEDAVFIGIQQMDANGQEGLALGPISLLGDRPDEKKAKMPFALYPNVILGQIPLQPEIDRMYREATSGIALLR